MRQVAPAGLAEFPRGYDAVSYALDLSVLDASGPFEGSLVLEIVARRAGLTEIGLDAVRLEIIGVVHTAGVQNHMAELNADFTKLYVDSAATDRSSDARSTSRATRSASSASPRRVSISPCRVHSRRRRTSPDSVSM